MKVAIIWTLLWGAVLIAALFMAGCSSNPCTSIQDGKAKGECLNKRSKMIESVIVNSVFWGLK